MYRARRRERSDPEVIGCLVRSDASSAKAFAVKRAVADRGRPARGRAFAAERARPQPSRIAGIHFARDGAHFTAGTP